jgi:sterol 24-C-methyltransferase
MELTSKQGLLELVNCRKADFQNLPFPDSSVEACYQIEATCHAADLVKVFSEVCVCCVKRRCAVCLNSVV